MPDPRELKRFDTLRRSASAAGGHNRMHMRMVSPAAWCLLLILLCSGSDADDGWTDVPRDAFSPAQSAQTGPFPETFPLSTNWRFQAGDRSEYANADFDDTNWVRLDSLGTLLLAESHSRLGWEGIGWFRLRLGVNRELQEKQLALVLLQSGAAQIFLDGKALLSIGTVGNSATTERAEFTLNRGSLIPFRFEPGTEHVVAVRYSNFWAIDDSPDSGLEVGFRMALVEPNNAIEPWLDAMRSFSVQQSFAVLPLGFALLHLLVFVFYRELRGNLHYALFAASVAVLIYAPLHGVTGGDPATHRYHVYLFRLSMVTTVLFGLRFLYGELLSSSPPRFFRIQVGVGLVMLLLAPFVDSSVYFYYFLVAFLPEVTRILYVGFRRRVAGCCIIGLGWIVFAVASVFQVLIELDHLEFDFVWFPYILGILALLVCMSTHLARVVARTNRDLEAQLAQVRVLSEQALAQERRAREEAVEREHLEAENALKTAQLEAAAERQKVLDELEQTNVELRHTQAKLVQSAKMAALGKLVAGITHEINTPVGAIRSTVDTLGRATSKLKEKIGASARDAAGTGVDRAFDAIAQSNRVIGEAVERITGIVGNLRSFARLDEAEFQVANLEEGMESTLAVMGPQIGEQISIVKDYAGIDEVHCSPAQLNNVFMHLITNAAQAMHGEGTITIATFQDDNRVHVRISDTGPGISPEQLEHIFDFDFRAGESRMKMGLGLVADYNIAQAHDGELSIDSQVGAGTQVTVSLPRRSGSITP